MMSPMPGNVRRAKHMKPCDADHVGSFLCFFLEQPFFRALWEWFHSWFIYFYLFVYLCFIYLFHIYIYIQCIHLHIRYIGGLLYTKATLQKAHDARDAYCKSPNLNINLN